METLFVLDAAGDLLTTNEPNPSARREAPAFYLAWSADGFAHAFGTGVPDSIREKARQLAESCWPFPLQGAPPCAQDWRAVFGESAPWSTGPAFVAPNELVGDGEGVAITRANAELLQGELEGWREDIEVEQPVMASVAEGRAVSVCGTVRRSVHGVEAGVDTVVECRRRGHGRMAVAAWAAAVQREGVHAFYSTWWANTASIGLAKSLGFNQIGAEFRIG